MRRLVHLPGDHTMLRDQAGRKKVHGHAQLQCSHAQITNFTVLLTHSRPGHGKADDRRDQVTSKEQAKLLWEDDPDTTLVYDDGSII